MDSERSLERERETTYVLWNTWPKTQRVRRLYMTRESPYKANWFVGNSYSKLEL